MTKMRKLAVFICMLSFLYGCAPAVLMGVGAGVGIGTYKYIEGNLAREYPLKYARAWNATNRALENLQISISSSMDEKGRGKIEAVRRDGKKVAITLKDKGMGVTLISVRVGLLGDRLEAEKIHNEMISVSGLK
ncbi:MAG: DUF3568 family protein [Thermodesulfovibrionia bacterium]|jgi:hypothetical protein|nr:DUF3568 family protein [Thermodesulfovibrionia bacterium]